MGGQHRPYTRQFREQAVKLVIAGEDATRTARELGMPHSTLMLWLRYAAQNLTTTTAVVANSERAAAFWARRRSVAASVDGMRATL